MRVLHADGPGIGEHQPADQSGEERWLEGSCDNGQDQRPDRDCCSNQPARQRVVWNSSGTPTVPQGSSTFSGSWTSWPPGPTMNAGRSPENGLCRKAISVSRKSWTSL